MNTMDTDNMQQQVPKNIEEYMGNKHEMYKRAFKEDDKVWHHIPLLNYTSLHNLEDQSLVRFRGMIQDMQDPEIYLEYYEVQNINDTKVRDQCGKYRDCLVLNECETINYDAESNVHGERRVLHVISIPALNEWCIEYEKTVNGKSPLHSMEVDETNGCERPGIACLIKIYEDFEAYGLNDIIDVIGFLSIDAHLDGKLMLTEFDNVAEVEAQNPPPSLIPRLHAVAIKKLSHANPLIDNRLQQLFSSNHSTYNETNFTELRTFLKLCCFNDSVAADYLLCHLISSVYRRCNQQCIGKLSLNLWNFPKEMHKLYTKDFYDLLSLMIPASHYLPMTLDNVNTMDFIPKKDYETNKLVPGLLQLGPQSHLILDETYMEQGKLESHGIQNLKSLAYLLNNQQMQCNFQFYNLDYNVDIPVLIYSEGRSMLPCDISLPLKAEAESIKIMTELIKAARHYLTQNNRLHRFRCYLTESKMMTYTIDPKDSEIVEQDFVEMRKKNSLMKADDLHKLLVLARLLAISRGKQTFDTDSWNLAKDMEFERNQRLSGLAVGRHSNPIF